MLHIFVLFFSVLLCHACRLFSLTSTTVLFILVPMYLQYQSVALSSDVIFFCVSLSDLAPGNDEIYEEKQENFMTAGNPQDGQVVLYKVGTLLSSYITL